MEYKIATDGNRQQCCHCQRKRWDVKGGTEYMMMEDGLTKGGEHIMEYIHLILKKYTLETYMVFINQYFPHEFNKNIYTIKIAEYYFIMCNVP